jgi:PadR family transcriptional regulator
MAELLKGTLDLLILRVLDLNAMHGSAIADRVAQVTKGTFQVKAGSLFPALHRLEQEGWIQGEWLLSCEGRRVRSYTLTRDGRRQSGRGKGKLDAHRASDEQGPRIRIAQKADAYFNQKIVAGLRRREPPIDFQSAGQRRVIGIRIPRYSLKRQVIIVCWSPPPSNHLEARRCRSKV